MHALVAIAILITCDTEERIGVQTLLHCVDEDFRLSKVLRHHHHQAAAWFADLPSSQAINKPPKAGEGTFGYYGITKEIYRAYRASNCGIKPKFRRLLSCRIQRSIAMLNPSWTSFRPIVFCRAMRFDNLRQWGGQHIDESETLTVL